MARNIYCAKYIFLPCDVRKYKMEYMYTNPAGYTSGPVSPKKIYQIINI